MNYTELIASVQTYTQNSEATFVAELPTFVKQMEDRVYHMIQFPVLRKSQEGTLTASNRFLTMPTDFISVDSLAVIDGSSDYHYLLDKDVNFLREAFPATGTDDLPRFYGLWDQASVIVAPTPDAGYSVILYYFYKPESLVTAGTTWLADENEAVVLYGTLVEAYTWMKGEPDLLQLYDTKFKEALVKAKELGDGKLRRDSYRSGQVRVPVQ